MSYTLWQRRRNVMLVDGSGLRKIAVLCIARKSVYRKMENLDLWDKERNAALYQGPYPVVAHPPCAQWSRLRKFARVDLEEKELGLTCLEKVRRFGGVLEHPAGSALFAGLPGAGLRDSYGGQTFVVDQYWFGFPARKRTWLYVVGLRGTLPPYPLKLGEGSSLVELMAREARSHTVPVMAEWLVAIARSTQLSLCTVPTDREALNVSTES